MSHSENLTITLGELKVKNLLTDFEVSPEIAEIPQGGYVYTEENLVQPDVGNFTPLDISYVKDSSNNVHLKFHNLDAGTLNGGFYTISGFLPEGYRPDNFVCFRQEELFGNPLNLYILNIGVNSNGDILINTENNDDIFESRCCFSFKVLS